LSPGYRKLYTYHSVAVDELATVDFPAPGTILHQNLLTEWQVNATNTNEVDVSTRREVFREAHPGDVHSGGGMDWGMDGYLYVSIGTPVPSEAQNRGNVLGTILRIDPLDPALTPESADPVSANGRYRVPATNPFISDPMDQDEIYAYGLRHPYRLSFDRETGLLFAADVGQATAEEVNVIVAGGNYGWPYREGSLVGPVPTPEPAPTMLDPIADYNSGPGEGRAVIGGFVYRGSAIPDLMGKYVFADLTPDGGPFGSHPGRLFWIDPYDESGQLKDASEIDVKEFIIGLDGDDPGAAILGMGIDEQGEIYIVGLSTTSGHGGSGIVRKIVRYIPLLGDMDADEDVDFDDIVPFVLGLNDPGAYHNQYGIPASLMGDIDQDSDLDFDDIDDFVSVLQAQVISDASHVPEPSALVLAGSCALVLLYGMRQRNRPRCVAVWERSGLLMRRHGRAVRRILACGSR
jgi:hypothetical protein